jgi:hypothetical protein
LDFASQTAAFKAINFPSFLIKVASFYLPDSRGFSHHLTMPLFADFLFFLQVLFCDILWSRLFEVADSVGRISIGFVVIFETTRIGKMAGG